jgi:uncharacterized protein YggE
MEDALVRTRIARRALVMSGVVMLSAVGLVEAQVPTSAAAPPQVVASASGEARLTPDRAAVYVGVQTRATTAAVAARDNAQRQRAIIDTIVTLGVPRDQISTESYNVSPEMQYDRDGQRSTVTGYVVSNVVRVELRRIDQVASVIDAALAKRANQINSLEFFSSNTDAARRQALAEAIGKARGDADAMARAAGGTLGGLLEASTAETGPRPLFRADMMVAKAAQGVPTPVEPGQQIVTVTVTTRWQFVVGR